MDSLQSNSHYQQWELAITGVEPMKLISKAVSTNHGRLMVSDIRNKTLTYDLMNYDEVS